MTLRTHHVLSRGLLCLIALWVLNLCWVGMRQGNDGAFGPGGLAQGHPAVRHGPAAKAAPTFSAASAPQRRAALRSQGA